MARLSLTKLVLLVSGVCISISKQEKYPAILWDPNEPIFSCDHPQIKVRHNDGISFNCPTSVKEDINIYFLGEKPDRYETCNITGIATTPFLKCSPGSPNSKDIQFRPFKTGIGSLEFNAGSTYYMIGTVGGSCNITTNRKYKMRLSFYVCTTQQKESGSCPICQSSGCYYKDCSKNCTSWQGINLKMEDVGGTGICSKLWMRNCTNFLLGIVTTEYNYTTMTCPTVSTTTSMTTSGGVKTTKPDHNETITGAAQTQNDNSKEKSRIIHGLAAGVVIAAGLGVLVGGHAYKQHHAKSCLNHQMRPNKVNLNKTESTVGFANNGYRPSISTIHPSVSEGYANVTIDVAIPEYATDVMKDDAFQMEKPK